MPESRHPEILFGDKPTSFKQEDISEEINVNRGAMVSFAAAIAMSTIGIVEFVPECVKAIQESNTSDTTASAAILAVFAVAFVFFANGFRTCSQKLTQAHINQRLLTIANDQQL